MTQCSSKAIQLFAACAVSMILATQVYGQGAGPGMGRGMGMGRNMPTFADFDLNKDGKIIESEFNQARTQRISERAQQGYRMRNIGNAPSFQAIDRNGDGAISNAEFAVHQAQRTRSQ